jgi:hypothetical protein
MAMKAITTSNTMSVKASPRASNRQAEENRVLF